MKIAHLTSVHTPFDTRIFHKECQTLARAGYDIVLVAPHERHETVDGIRIHAISQPHNRRERMIRTAGQVYRAALQEDAAIYHLHDPELLPYGQLLRLKGKKVIFDVHENIPKSILTKTWLPRYFRKFSAKLYGVVERGLLHGMAVIFAERSYRQDYPWVTEYTEILNMPKVNELLKIKIEKYTVPTVGYIGNITAARGSLLTIETLKILRERGIAVNLELVGRAVNLSEITALIDTYKLAGINLRGYMQPPTGWRIMAQCHVGLAILKPIPNYIESFPTKLFEYMGLGLPVIVSDFPLYREVVTTAQCGLLVNPLDSQAIANAIIWLLAHPAEAAAMGKRGQEAVRARYNWTVEAQKLLDFYMKIRQ